MAYTPPSAGGTVTSVFSRAGAVSAATNDYTWAQVNKATSSLADLTTKAYSSLTGLPTLGSAAATAIADYATAAQGALAGTALQPAGNGSALTGLTKSQVSLGNVDNTSDASKPVSTATQTALDSKQALLVNGTNIKSINGSTVLGSGDLVVSGTQPDIPQVKLAPTSSQTIAAGYSAYVCGPYEIVTATSLEIGVGACLEIG